MPVIAVINRKGGSGKSTLATHLAAYCAATGKKVMLGDVDRQQSAQTWLRLRGAQKLATQSAIQGWTLDPKNVLRAPAGVTHVILDTPGGMRGFELSRIVMSADVILMPVCNSVFDRESAAECYAELKSLPRVATGRCKIAAIGMRLDSRTRADNVLAEWARAIDLPFVGVLREAQSYVKCIELGLTLFDLPKSQVLTDLAQWKPIITWLEDAVRAPEAASAAKNTAANPRAAEAVAKPVPAQILAVQPKADPVRYADPPHPVRAVAQVERAPQGELAHAGTLASIGELARTLRAAESRDAENTPRLASRGTPADASTDAPAVPLRPTRPIVAPVGRPDTAGARKAAPPVGPTAPQPDTTARSSAAVRAAAPSSPAPSSPVQSTPRTAAPVRPAGSVSKSNATRAEPARPAIGTRLGQLLDTLPIPRFLQRNS